MEDKHIMFIVLSAVVILVGLALYTTLDAPIGTMAVLQNSNNSSFTVPAQATVTDLTACGQANTSVVRVFNESNDVEYPAANYTVSQGTSDTDGYLVTQINFTGTFGGVDEAGTTATVDCDYQARGYITEGGGRAVALLIPIFFAILIALTALVKRDWLKGVFSR